MERGLCLHSIEGALFSYRVNVHTPKCPHLPQAMLLELPPTQYPNFLPLPQVLAISEARLDTALEFTLGGITPP